MSTRVPSLARRLVAAVLVATVISITVHLATIIVYAISQGLAANSLDLAHGSYLSGSLFVFLFVFVIAAVGGFTRWYLALASGLVIGIVAPLLGLIPRLTAAGVAITIDILVPLFGTLAGISLLPFLATVIASVALGPVVWRRALAAPSTFRGQDRVTVLVRTPSPRLAEGEITHIDRTPIDFDLAEDQWDAYVSALANEGWDTVEVDAAPDHPDSVFVEDAIVVFGSTAVITSPGAESRRGEIEAVERAARSLRLRIERIQSPGLLDGGDVLKVGSTVYVGRGGRTNAEGIRQLRAITANLGYTVVAVPMTKALHLKTAVTALPDGTVIGYLPLIDDVSVFDRFLAVPEAHGTAVVVLAPDAVLMSSAAPATAELIRELGYRVETVDISEFERMEGCVTCLSVRVR
jgi:dimethylargininase